MLEQVGVGAAPRPMDRWEAVSLVLVSVRVLV